MIARILAGALLAVPLAVAVPPASSADIRQTLEVSFTTSQPNSSSGLSQLIHYPDAPGGKPHSVRKVDLLLPEGMRIDTSVPTQCKASDAELIALGVAACPPASRVGTATISVDFGTGPVTNSVTLMNNRDQLILLIEPDATLGLVRIPSRFVVGSRSITGESPPLPGLPPPDPYMAIVDVELDLRPVSVNGRNYITTPTACPRSRLWTTVGTFTYADGVKQAATTTQPCQRRPGR